jgi:hypothetical protein
MLGVLHVVFTEYGVWKGNGAEGRCGVGGWGRDAGGELGGCTGVIRVGLEVLLCLWYRRMFFVCWCAVCGWNEHLERGSRVDQWGRDARCLAVKLVLAKRVRSLA